MKRTFDSRPLLLEQLEPRKMLAGGLLSHADGTTGRDLKPDANGDRQGPRDDDRPSEVRVMASHQVHSPLEKPAKEVGHRDNGARRPDAPQAGIDVQVTPTLTTPESVPINSSPAVDQGSSKQTVIIIDLLKPAQERVAPPSTPPAASEASQNASDRQSGARVPTFVSVGSLPEREQANDVITVQPEDDPAAVDRDPSLTARGEDSPTLDRTKRADSSFVQPLPSSQATAFMPATQSLPADWEIDAESLLRLREMSQEDGLDHELPESNSSESILWEPEETSEVNHSTRFEGERRSNPSDTDAVIAGLSADQGRLIEIDWNDSMPLAVSTQPTREIVRVVLRATLGLNQRIALLASEHQLATAESIRDQVLTARG